ncbi:MAG: hypothetical protein Q9168_004724, partial [Polycauliona sp. 1 TL-2023]
MAQAGKFLFPNEEDVLISRGANPRTGLISPFVSDENGDSNVETDYVQVRNARQESEPTRTIPYPSWPCDMRGNRDLRSPARRRTPSLTCPPTHQISSPSTDSLFEIPRKPVGSPRASSTPRSKGNSSTSQVFGHLKRMSGAGKRLKGTPSTASPGSEIVALGPNSYPYGSSKNQGTKYDRTHSLPSLQQFSSDKEHGPDSRYRKEYTLNDYVAS